LCDKVARCDITLKTVLYLRCDIKAFTDPDTVTRQPRFKSGGLCHRGRGEGPAGAGLPWDRKFDGVDKLKQEIVQEWRALAQRFNDHSICEERDQTYSEA